MMTKRKLILILALFIIVITGARILWLNLFMEADQPYALRGELDLREWDAALDRTITLDGDL
jgi:two-component system sensor histidine kinase ChiS